MLNGVRAIGSNTTLTCVSIGGAGRKARKQPETRLKQVTEYVILESVDAAMLLLIVSTNYK